MTGTSRCGISHQNDFVTRLIRLQQDGKEAISGPGNWLEPPLLEVSTELEEKSIVGMINAMVPARGQQGRGRWHWLIGSPGNGKSAKLGMIARHLLQEGFEIINENGASIEGQAADWLPYLLEVREKGKPYRFAYLVQDASVVRSPYDAECDPARDLEEVLREAWNRGLSLLLCTNWGVIQRLFDIGHTNPTIRNEEWFRAVREAVSSKNRTVSIRSGQSKNVFKSVDVTYEYLDNRSLLVNSNTFKLLLDKATAGSRWGSCDGCPSRRLCPLRANRDDLLSDAIQTNVVDTLRRAEVLSGQTIVFREAVALVSLFLAGCPNDHGGRVPCGWVHDQVKDGKAFNLLARRLPMLLFGASRPYGLEGRAKNSTTSAAVQRREIESLKAVRSLLNASSTARQALDSIVRGGELSLDVGVERLVGPNGVVTKLDPSLDPRHALELDEFVANVTSNNISSAASAAVNSFSGLRCIDVLCLEHWNVMFDAVEGGEDPVLGPDMYFWLRRWQTTCLAWMAGTSRGLNALQPELDRYLEFSSVSGQPTTSLAMIRGLERVLEEILAPHETPDRSGVHIKLSPSMWLSGRWAENELRPRLEHRNKRATNVLRVKMGEGHTFVVSAETFAWLSRRYKLKLSDLSFNPDVLDALKRTQAQAAAASNYSLQNDDVVIVVTDDQGNCQRLERIRGALLPEGS